MAAEIAGKQWGVIGSAQLRACGVGGRIAAGWRRAGRLHRLHPGVDALGHPTVPTEGRMVAALLYAGPDAVLSHHVAAWWWGLTKQEPTVIDVSSSLRAGASNGVIVHRRRGFERTRHRRFPVTTVPQTFLDLAATAPLAVVRRALAEADYQKLFDPRAVVAITGQGKPGSQRLREAVERHQPRLAHTRSYLEERFLALLENEDLPLPELNVRLAGWTVDALWRQQRVVVELDGYDNHHTPAQIQRDRRKELALRAAGFVVLRYTLHQVTEESALVIADLAPRLSPAARSAGGGSR
jgi:very-short-patch-repair endonuclease